MIRKNLIYPIAAVALAVAGCQEMGPLGVPSQTTLPSVSDMTTPQNGAAGDYDSYIVVMHDDAGDNALSKMTTEVLGLNKGIDDRVFRDAIKGFVAKLSAEKLAQLRLDPRVKYVEPDYKVQLTPTYVSYYSVSTQSTPWGVQKVGGARDGTGKVAWIVDTGIDLDHPDLNVDQYRSRNFVYDGRANADDGNGHGTHVAGIVGAKNNTIDVVGVAPNATLVGVRVLDNNGAGTYSSIIAGIDYVTKNGRAGDVMNLSLGGPASYALDDAVRRAAAKGIRVVIAAGNSAANANYTSPARVNAANVFTVSAVDQNGYRASFSNWGNPPIDIAAPGVSILSTRMGGGTVYMSGTSMAAPHVTGLLLFGTLRYYGYAKNDPDGTADPLAYR